MEGFLSSPSSSSPLKGSSQYGGDNQTLSSPTPLSQSSMGPFLNSFFDRDVDNGSGGMHAMPPYGNDEKVLSTRDPKKPSTTQDIGSGWDTLLLTSGTSSQSSSSLSSSTSTTTTATMSTTTECKPFSRTSSSGADGAATQQSATKHQSTLSTLGKRRRDVGRNNNANVGLVRSKALACNLSLLEASILQDGASQEVNSANKDHRPQHEPKRLDFDFENGFDVESWIDLAEVTNQLLAKPTSSRKKRITDTAMLQRRLMNTSIKGASSSARKEKQLLVFAPGGSMRRINQHFHLCG
eukprot:CAMPEP_0119550834 /NCGR_PEP_ID=MMETSP1352-20130426/4270_1 /TAXON_ID=265584 /ORGANISM="Stauroneis constricta, Strain CCMP1120" /LENGTH=295 /DNA_ID=CAMNT_0007596805 /DNA_START=251 /DNA_END=1138 /DNA_ORIENTATION=+